MMMNLKRRLIGATLAAAIGVSFVTAPVVSAFAHSPPVKNAMRVRSPAFGRPDKSLTGRAKEWNAATRKMA